MESKRYEPVRSHEASRRFNTGNVIAQLFNAPRPLPTGAAVMIAAMALVGTASAQSSVLLYGQADMFVGGVKAPGAASRAIVADSGGMQYPETVRHAAHLPTYCENSTQLSLEQFCVTR